MASTKTKNYTSSFEKKLENFIDAFDGGVGSCRATCHCGSEFYNPDYHWDFEEDEIEKLENDGNAVSLDHAVNYVVFEGRTYVTDCTCWYERAGKIMNFIDGHSHKIAKYLTLEKKRKEREAELSPVVEV